MGVLEKAETRCLLPAFFPGAVFSLEVCFGDALLVKTQSAGVPELEEAASDMLSLADEVDATVDHLDSSPDVSLFLWLFLGCLGVFAAAMIVLFCFFKCR